MRDGFREISSGWMLVDDDADLADRIHRLMVWVADHKPFEADELATIKFMMESLLARELRDAGLGIPSL
jgi:hypothetical protein